MGVWPPCPWCGRACSCTSGTTITVSYHESYAPLSSAAANFGQAVQRFVEESKRERELRLARERTAEAIQRATLLDRSNVSQLPIPEPRTPKRNRVCSRAEFWRAA